MFFIISFLFWGKGIDAYNLNFYARESSDGKYYVFSTSVGASEHSKNEFIKKAISLGINPVSAREKIYMTPVGHVGDGKTGVYLGGDSYYDVTGLLVHKKNFGNLQLFSNYKSENENDVEIYYDVFSGDASSINYLENVTSGKGRVGERKIGNSVVNPDFEYYFVSREGFNNSSNANKFYTKYTISKDGSKVIYEYYISKSALDHNANWVEYEDEYGIKYRKYAISLQLTTLKHASVDNPKVLKTSYQFYEHFFSGDRWFSPGNKGMDYSGNWAKGTSSANDMDNYLYVYDSGVNLDGNVVVNHIIHLSNGDTKVTSEGREKVAGESQGTGSDNRTYTFTNFKINRVVPVELLTKDIEYENKKYTCKEADVRYPMSNNSSTGYSINYPINVNLTDYDNEVYISYHYYPENYREIYVGYFDEEGNKLDFSPMKRRDYYEDKKNNYTIRNQLYGYQDNYEEKYSTESSLYIEPIVTNPTIGETNYSLKGVQINKSDSSNYKNLIGTEDGSFYSNSALIDQKSYTVKDDGQNYYVAFIYKKGGKEDESHYWYAYIKVSDDGKDESILYKSQRLLLTSNTVGGMKNTRGRYSFRDGYMIEGERGSTFNSLYKKYKTEKPDNQQGDVKTIRGTNDPDSYEISDGGKDVLIIFRYTVPQNNFLLGVARALSNSQTRIAFSNIENDKREEVTNIDMESNQNSFENTCNIYELDISKSSSTVTNNIINYKNNNAMYKYNNKYYLKYEESFDKFKWGISIKDIIDDKGKKGIINVDIKDVSKKYGAKLVYFYNTFPKRKVTVYRKYIDDKNNEYTLESPTGKYTTNNFNNVGENQYHLMGIFYYGEKSTMPSVANNLKYITANEKDIYEYNGKVKITYYNGSNDKSPISNNYTQKGLGTSISISSTNSKNKKQIDIVFYYTKKPDPEWITVCPKLNFKTVADYLKKDKDKGEENIVDNGCNEKDETYECTDNDIKTQDKTQELVVPIGENIKPIVTVPKVILIDSLSYSYDNTRGGIWQEVSEKDGKYSLRVVGYKALVLTEVKIKQNDGSNFVSLLSKDKVVYTNPNINNNSILSTELVDSNLGKNIGEALSKKFEYSGSSRSAYENHVYKYATSLTEINNYITDEIAGSNITIDTNACNGVKSAYATVKYKAVNIGITDFSYYSNISPYLKEGSSNSVLGGDNSNNESGDYERTTKDSVKKKEYSSNSSYVNVYAPLLLRIDVNGINTVDHTTGKANSTLIQNNANLKVTATIQPLNSYPNMSIQHIKDKYLGAYYYKFGFKVNYMGKTYAAGSWIKSEDVEYNDKGVKGFEGETITVRVNDSKFDDANNTTTSVVSDYINEIACMAVTKNIPDYVTEDLTKIYNRYSTDREIIVPTDCTDNNTNNKWSEKLKSNNKVKQDAYYAFKATKKIASIGRIYDFRITDCTDVDFKSVFRDSSKSGVNSLSGIVYFSGIKELEIFNSSTSNVLTNRKSPYTIPLGPYKHTNSNYVDAPKMGYRISFDVKTTGNYVTTSEAADKLEGKYEKYVKITPSYYYIKKDGSEYNEKITLYYKNSSNKYVKFIGSGFEISYKPNDGYRNVTNLGITNVTNMFTDKYVTLEVSSQDGFTLNIDSMCTNYSGYVQSWYGEFKLPNTTIAVADGGSVTKPLTDGYIGVKFDIKCVYKYDTQTTEVSYNTPNKNAKGTNTTQWDYEGYLGFKNAGKKVAESDGLYLQFPKGKLLVPSQSVYEQIRGTVVFFDLDNRASNDFE